MITKDEIIRIIQASNIITETGLIYRNNRFPDQLITTLITDDDTPSIYVDLFEKSQSNEGYSKFRLREINDGFDDLNTVTEESPNSNNLYPFPSSGLTEDIMLNIGRMFGMYSDLNIFLPDRSGNQLGIGTNNQGIPNMMVLYGKYSSKNMGIYQFKQLNDFEQISRDFGYFYDVNGQMMNEDQYNQYINDNQ